MRKTCEQALFKTIMKCDPSPPRATTHTHVWMELARPAAPATLIWSSTSAFLVDLDGVVWSGEDRVIAGAEKFFARCAGGSKKVVVVTNNSTRSREAVRSRLASLAGLNVAQQDIWTSGSAAAAILKDRGVAACFAVGLSGLTEELVAAGIRVVGISNQSTNSAREDVDSILESIELDPAVSAVVVGLDTTFSYAKLATATAYLRTPQADGTPRLFLATNRDAGDVHAHLFAPGGGCMVAAVALAAGREPDVVAGKPSAALIDAVLRNSCAGEDPRNVTMVGDRIDTDMALARNGGVRAVLVGTGVASASDAAKAVAQGHVDAFLPNGLADLVSA